MGWGSAAKLGRPYDRHIDNEELNALVPSSSEIGHEQHGHGLGFGGASIVEDLLVGI